MKNLFILFSLVIISIVCSLTIYSQEEQQTPITLPIGNKILEGYLNNSISAKSLISQLPLTITLNDSDNDFCGGNLNIKYNEKDIQNGYKDGDIMFWTPANNFVIFVDDEENSFDTGNLVSLGHITSPKEQLKELNGKITVTIALKKEEKIMNDLKIKITVNNTELIADMENNIATQTLIKQMPITLSMLDLYEREMCYRFGNGFLPTDKLSSNSYEIGDIVYWPPAGSLVILYKQNGEKFSHQYLGHINNGVEIFSNTGNTEVTFELLK